MSKVISMSEFRKRIFPIFMMIKDTELVLRVYYRRRVFLFTITPTEEKVKTPYKRSKTNANNKIDPGSVSKQKCPICKDAVINGVCMNTACASNVEPTEKASHLEVGELTRVPIEDELYPVESVE